MKKLLLIISMLAVIFSMSACTENTEKAFEYDKIQLIYETENLSSAYLQLSNNSIKYYEEGGSDLEKSLAKGISQLREADKVTVYGQFDPAKAVVEDNGTSVLVTVVNKAQDRDVEITVTYVENKEYNIKRQEAVNALRADIEATMQQYNHTEEEILSSYGLNSFEEGIAYMMQGIYPYEPVEAEVNAVYTTAETMKQAGMNTLIGMGTVFSVLIFISFIISLMKFIPMILEKKNKKDEPVVEKVAVSKAPAIKPVVEKDLMDDSELVAVITAAIYAASASNGAISKDTLIVRSIKRARR